ncbi:hypothetical protein BH24ACT15_BH24ACT15_32180 [soil metagenome]
MADSEHIYGSRDRLGDVDDLLLKPQSLLGSYFHTFEGDDPQNEVAWQGVVVADVGQGYYLVELMEWVIGSSSCQRLVHISAMASWAFYDTREWRDNRYTTSLQQRSGSMNHLIDG